MAYPSARLRPHHNGNGRIWALYNVSLPSKQGPGGICQRGPWGLSGSLLNRMIRKDERG
jgi:hypothetical protein